MVSIFYNVSDFLVRRYCRYPLRAFFVLELNHASETLECDIRTAVSKSQQNKCALVISCRDLDLDEYTILWRLTDSYDHIVIATPEDLTEKIETAKSINASL